MHITESGLLIDDEMIDLPQSVVYSGSFEMPTYFGTESPVSIPGERFFVIGDNMPIARDSRVFGFISIERITGVVVGY